MSDLKFAMIFEVRGMDAAAAEMKRMRDIQKGLDGEKAATDAVKAEKAARGAADAGQKAADAAKREAQATKEVARNRAAANEQARADGVRAERDIRRRAQIEKAASDEARRARGREVTAAREQMRIDEQRRAAEVKAARAVRLQELARRAELQRQDNMAAAAQRDAASERSRMEERVAASIAKRTGRPVQDILAEQRAAGQAAERASQQAARAESRWRRLGETIRQSMRGVRWNRVAAEAGAELGKHIARSVAEAVGRGIREGVTSARGFVSRAIGGDGARGAVRASSGVGWGLVRDGVSRNQQGMDAENAMLGILGRENARVARAEAEAASKRSGGLIPLDQSYGAARALSEGGIVADQKLMKLLSDSAVASGEEVSALARDYERALREGNASFAAVRGAAVKSGEDGSQTLSYKSGGRDIERTVTAGDRAGLETALREFMARNEGASERKLATPAGIREATTNSFKANAADALEEPFRKATEWMQKLNDAVTNAGGARDLGHKIAEGMDKAEKTVLSIATGVEKMVAPVDQVAQALGGWKVAVGGIVALAFAPWLTAAAAGIRAVAGASVFLAATPAGRVITGAAAGGYLAHEWWTKEPAAPAGPPPSRQDVYARRRAMDKAILAGARPQPTEPVIPAPPPASTGPAAHKQAEASQAGEKAVQALAMIEQVAPAARQMVSEVDTILAGADFTARGVAMMTTLAAGIRSGSAAAVGAVREVTQQMRDHLPHSPAKVGPLSDLDRVKFSETLALAIRPDAAIRAVHNLVAGMRAAIPGSFGLGGLAAAVGPQGAAMPRGSAGRDPLGAAPGSALAKAAGGASPALDAALRKATLAAAGVPEGAVAPRAARRRDALGAPEGSALAKAAGGASRELDEALRQATMAAAYGPDTGAGAGGKKGRGEVPAVTSRAGPQNSLSVQYAPNVTFNGGEVGDFWSQLEGHKDSLVGMIQGSFSRSRDLSFGGN